GEVDFDAAARAAAGGSPNTANAFDGSSTPAATASSSPVSGIVDFSISVTYDIATGTCVDQLTLGAAPADINGLRTWKNTDDNLAVDILGAVMILAPIVSAATQALDPKLTGEWVEAAVDIAVPAAAAALGLLKTTSITLYGGSLVIRDNIPSGKITNAALTFDYGVNFYIPLEACGIQLTQPPIKPMSVRYQAVGVSMLFGKSPKVEIALDTSKGYALNLSDPGLFNLAGGLGDILKIAGARIARFNPLTVELDIEMKADLGIITVDKFMVKIPLDGSSLPSITPSAIGVNIPETVTGIGSIDISGGGFDGSLDVTLCPLGLRMMAQVGVHPISQGARKVTAFYFGFEIDFPAPIMLGDTGLSLFGIFGLFGMHYDRLLPQTAPGDAVGPDLRWLLNSGGQPQLLESETDPSQKYWVPKIDNWAFGLGAILGTSDGILITLRGMLILELPGPRIIITVNLKFVVPLPALLPDKMDATDLDVGVIGILDLDFGAGQITLGVMIDLAIQDLITIQIPVQLYFNWNNPSDWHFWIGTIQTPASAQLLGIVKGSGYFMLGGQAITPFPPGTTGVLPGVAVAMGIAASIVWGGSKIYLKVSASADFGVSFSPTLFIVGSVHLDGSLHLVVVDIGVDGDFELKAPNPVYLKVHVCGKVDAFFVHIKACVDFNLGTDSAPLAPPPLVTNLYLQSFAPVIAQGQADRPIDASLGNAWQSGAPNNQPMPVVPIDSVPVIQLQYGVDVGGISTFTAAIPPCPSYPAATSGVNLGGNRFASYKVTNLSISPALAGGYQPPVAWRPNKPSADTSQTNIDLALFTRNPNVTTSALERSNQFTASLEATWGETCTPIAPPACVLWDFCGQLLGPSSGGWTLSGTPSPDPPNTFRSNPVPTVMKVIQPGFSSAEATLLTMGLPLAGLGLQPAQVVGPDRLVLKGGCMRGVELPELIQQALVTSVAAAYPLPPPQLETPSPMATAQKNAIALVGSSRWLRFVTGAANRIRIFLAIDSALYTSIKTAANQNWVTINERNSGGGLVASHPLASLNPTVVAGVSNLPSDWSTTVPWKAATASICSYLTTIRGMTALLIDFVPNGATTTIGIDVAAPAASTPRQTVIVGAIEACLTSETIRYQTGLAVQQSTSQALTSYLDGGAPVPLLQPATTYTVSLTYSVAITDAVNGNSTVPAATQSFQFTTNAQPPDALDPWVLCTSPAQGETFMFYEDLLQVVFNDASVFSLFEGYGYGLNMQLRAADGLPEGSPGGSSLTGASPAFEPVNGVGPAAYDTMLGIARKLSCLGTLSEYQNQRYNAPVYLRPLMGYTFDLVTDPPTPPSSPGIATKPLFRRSFSTGRYASMQALAADLGRAPVTHRILKQPLSFPAGEPFSPSNSTATVVMDADILQAFLGAGEQALAAPSANAIVMYWLLSNNHYVPHAVLIDSIEPVWRYRQEPNFSNPVPSDPSFQTVTIGSVPSLEVAEAPHSGSAAIGTFYVSPGGARTVAVFSSAFSPPAGGATVGLQLLRPASATYGNADETASVVQLTVTPYAPWENDHV
ncbi:MAG TPA: hypothetical protein VMU19_01970, partial [Bryobacteraceae bacterium]|nr:hypothetical protein [Bryobacteraceae bacterium]